MRSLILAVALVILLASCDNNSTSSPPSSPSTSDGTLQGAFKSVVAVKGEYQTYTFGAGSQFIYKVEQGTCLTELDTGTAQLQTIQGTEVLQMTLTKGSGSDWNYLGTGCAPLVKYTADQIAVIGGPYAFRWVTQGTSFEIQISNTEWFRFNKVTPTDSLQKPLPDTKHPSVLVGHWSRRVQSGGYVDSDSLSFSTDGTFNSMKIDQGPGYADKFPQSGTWGVSGDTISIQYDGSPAKLSKYTVDALHLQLCALGVFDTLIYTRKK